ncbi:MAG: hypothetical protein HPY76_14895 [Anaerolineae bacterium]|jgi:hypothetical protein|nr:hypothetical protein [Anaerolineae bacterium]
MDKLQTYLKNPWVLIAIGFVIGLIIGLPVLGWGLAPVQWTDAGIDHLRSDLKEDYLRMTIESFSLNEDAALAMQRWEALGEDGPILLEKVSTDPALEPVDVAMFSGLVLGGVTLPTGVPGEVATLEPGEVLPLATDVPDSGGLLPTAAPGDEGGFNPVTLLGILCLLTLIVGAALAFVLMRRRKSGGKPFSFGQVGKPAVEEEEYYGDDQDTPMGQFMSLYNLGDDSYDDSFSIDSSNGEFLGECGVGISEMIGVGDPKKVTAFEIWLFDKNDIQTVTKVLMSDHAYHDPAITQRLASKGEPVLLEKEKRILLETATLQLEAHIVDMAYAQGALPTGSYFDRLSIELVVWSKG